MATNEEIIQKMETQHKEFTSFVDKYEVDMRGDAKVNGNRGLVGEVREIKRYIRDNPSLVWLAKNKPIKTVAWIVVTFLVLSALYIYEVRTAVLAVLGISLPLPPMG